MSLVWRLYLLIALALLPAVGIQAWSEVALRRERTAASHEHALRLAQIAAAEIERLVDGGRVLLTTLSGAAPIRSRDREGCAALIGQAMAGLPQFAALGAVDQSGEWICRHGFASGLDSGSSQWRAAALASAGPVVIGYVAAGADDRPMLVLAKRYFDLSGAPSGTLVVGIDLDWLRDHFAALDLSDRDSITIADRAGTVLVRLPPPPIRGEQVRNRALLEPTGAATTETVGRDGVQRILGYVPPGGPGGSEFLVAVGLAKISVMAASNAATWRSIVLIGLGAVAALLAAWLGARLFVRRPAKALMSAAEAWSRGDLAAHADLPSGQDEFGRLAAAFATMAGLLQGRELELKASETALRQRGQMLSLVEGSAEIGAWEIDVVSQAVRGTPHFFRLHGAQPEEGFVPHAAIRASQHPDDRRRVAAEFARVVANGADQFEVEYRVSRSTGVWHWLLGRGHVLRDRNGQVTGYAGIDMDITERKAAEAALHEGDARLRLALEAGRMGVFDIDLDRQRVIWDDTERQLFGVEEQAPTTPGEALELIHPDDREAFRQAVASAITAMGDYRSEFRVPLEDGGTRWLAQRGMVLGDGEGRRRLTGVDWDITERKQLEQRQQLLIGELNHRVKNLLGIIQSIVQQSGREETTAEALREALHGRLRAMAVAHEILAVWQWSGAELEAVLRGTLAPHVEGEPGRLTLEVERVVVNPSTAQSLSLAMNELATNATKYGAWSVPGGTVGVEGRVHAAGGLTLTWIESGGPPVEEPSRQGFGSLMLSRAFAYETGGKVELDWRPDGLRCTIHLPQGA